MNQKILMCYLVLIDQLYPHFLKYHLILLNQKFHLFVMSLKCLQLHLNPMYQHFRLNQMYLKFEMNLKYQLLHLNQQYLSFRLNR
jgi:hypothetical protein